MKRWELFACKRLPVLFAFLFLLCGARECFASKLTVRLYDAGATGTPQFFNTQTVNPWYDAVGDTDKELIHVKAGFQTDSGSVIIKSFTLVIQFDKDYFEVTDANGAKITSLTGLSPYFPVSIGTPCSDFINTVDYTSAPGTISYTAWALPSGWTCPAGATSETPLTVTSAAPSYVADFYLKPLKGTAGAEKALKIDIDNDNTFATDANEHDYKKSDTTYTMQIDTQKHGTTGYKFKIRPIPPTLALPVETTNTKVTLTWTANDTTATKYNVYRAETDTQGAAEPTSFPKKLTTQDIDTTTTYEDTTILWSKQYRKYWYKVVAKDTASTESCTASPAPAYSQCVTQGIADTLVPAIQSFKVTETVFDKIKVSATLDEPGFIKAMYSCPICQTPTNDKETAYQPSVAIVTPTVALSSSGLIPTSDFVAADEGKTVTFKIKAKDAAGHELTVFSSEKTFQITTCTETAAPNIETPTTAVSCPSDMTVSWSTGAKTGDSTIYFSNSASSVTDAQGGFKKAFENSDASVYKCNDAEPVKSHSLKVPSCGAVNKAGTPLSALETGIPYFYQICSTNCFGENCSVSTNTFTFDVALNVTHACSTTQAALNNAYLLTATYTGGCPTVKADIVYDAGMSTLSSSTSPRATMTDTSGTFSGSVPSTYIVSPLAAFVYYIEVKDGAGSLVEKPSITQACPVTVIPPTGQCTTPTASCSNKDVGVGETATVNLEIKDGKPSYSCDLYFGTSESSVTEKITSSPKSVSANGSYQETIPATKTGTAGTFYFKSKCTDSCTEGGAKTAESSPCQLVVTATPVEKSTVSGTVKASDTSAALAGATVKLTNTATSQSAGLCDDDDTATTTDCITSSTGLFQFKDVPVKAGPSAYRVTVTASGYSTKLVGVDSLTSAGASTGDIILDKTTKITGRCTDNITSTGISGLKVKVINGATGAKSETTTDANGDYSVEDLSSGTYSVDVDVAGTKYKKPTTQNITVGPADGKADFSLEASPITTVTIVPSTKSIGFNEQTAFYVDKVLTGSGAALPKTPVEWDVSKLTSLGTVSYSDGNKTILLFKSSTTEGSAIVTVTKVGGENVPAGSVSTATLTITPTLAVKEIKLLMPVTSGTKISASTPMKRPITKDVGYVIIESEVTHSNVSVVYKIYNMQGRLMQVLNADPATQQANWDCTDASGARLPNGIYIIQAEASGGGQSAHAGKPRAVGCLW